MAGYLTSDTRKVTTHRLTEMKQRGEKISMLTAYDYTMAQIVDGAGMDVILVGDSASNVMAGNVTTLPITVDQMIYHGKSVVRGVKRALVVVDMPFGSYQADLSDGVRNAMSINKYGTYGVRAKEEAEAEKLVRDAHLLEEIGCFSVVLEKVPAELAARVASELTIPVIGIGAGGGVDGQVLVVADMLGMTKGFSPKFLRRYADLNTVMTDAIGKYVADVKSCDFPNESEQY